MQYQRWKLVDADNTRVAWFGSDAMVFNPTTWHTHLVNDAAGTVIAALKQSPLSHADLAAALGLGGNDADLAALDGLLEELNDVYLVETDDDVT